MTSKYSISRPQQPLFNTSTKNKTKFLISDALTLPLHNIAHIWHPCPLHSAHPNFTPATLMWAMNLQNCNGSIKLSCTNSSKPKPKAQSANTCVSTMLLRIEKWLSWVRISCTGILHVLGDILHPTCIKTPCHAFMLKFRGNQFTWLCWKFAARMFTHSNSSLQTTVSSSTLDRKANLLDINLHACGWVQNPPNESKEISDKHYWISMLTSGALNSASICCRNEGDECYANQPTNARIAQCVIRNCFKGEKLALQALSAAFTRKDSGNLATLT